MALKLTSLPDPGPNPICTVMGFVGCHARAAVVVSANNAVVKNFFICKFPWSVNFLKSTVVNVAIKHGFATKDLVSWLDFGYCRTADKIPSSKKWSYDFDVTKMHLFNYKEYDNRPINEIISTNDVYILGAKIVGGRTVWPEFQKTMAESLSDLIDKDLVDDDQTIMLLSTIKNPSLFQLHKIPDHQLGLDPFVIFSDFNKEV